MKTELLRDAYYARVAPLFGTALQAKVAGIAGDAGGLDIALLLARCGVLRFASNSNPALLLRKLREQNPLEDRFVLHPMSDADVIFCGPGSRHVKLRTPKVRLIFCPATNVSAQLEFLRAEEPSAENGSSWPEDPFDRTDALNRSAAVMRNILSGNFPEHRVLLMGHSRWPWWMQQADAAVSLKSSQYVPAVPHTSVRRGRVLMIGCGSIGSAAAVSLAPHVKHLALCDPEKIEIENPVRQEFAISEIGEHKAMALARRCALAGAKTQGFVRTINPDVEPARFAALLRTVQPDLVILATGTSIEFSAAALLRKRGIRHIAARCYARARYFEIIAVNGKRGPCYGCLRDQLNLGPSPALTPEQRRRYDPDFRPGELNAEPASVLETGRCAAVLARIARAMLLTKKEQPPWLVTTFQQERCCFIGANHAECDRNGNWCYGLDLPGKVATFGPEDVTHVSAVDACDVCARRWAS